MQERNEDVLIIKGCKEGDETSFKKLFDKYQQRAYSISYNILGDKDMAMDVVQEAFIRVFKNIKRFDMARNFYTWFYQIVVNLSIDFLRKRSSLKISTVDDPLKFEYPKTAGSETGIIKGELKEKIRKIINMMPLKYKVVLVLRDIEGLSCEEIAWITNSKGATVRWRIHRARMIFKNLWNGQKVDLGEYFDSGVI